ncbi:MAG: hypothetical protein HQL84_16085 [Magnetococcales bacterium]|nr:hypothetical protein [Magnetococcales bacterium]MBF0151540.1 hypothetical protein [Magnetococcales bacterium]
MATFDELQLRRDQLLKRLESLQRRVQHGDKVLELDLSQAHTALELLEREMARTRDGGILRQLRVRSGKDL